MLQGYTSLEIVSKDCKQKVNKAETSQSKANFLSYILLLIQTIKPKGLKVHFSGILWIFLDFSGMLPLVQKRISMLKWTCLTPGTLKEFQFDP